MRILQLFGYDEFGGVETYTRDLFRELEQRGHHNVLFHSGRRLAGLDQPGRAIYTWPGSADLAESPRPVVTEMLRLLEQEQPDVAFIHSAISGALASTILGSVPTVYFAHTYAAFCPSGTRLFRRSDTVCGLTGVPDRRCLVNAYLQACNTRRPNRLWASYARAADTSDWTRRSEAVVCDSAYVAERHVENGFSRDRLHVLPSPVPIPDSSAAGDSVEDDMVLFVGRLLPEKGVDYLIRALARVPGCRLKVVGAGREFAGLTRLAAREGVKDRVTFMGRLDREALGRMYAAASMVVVPSVWPEPFGMVGPEAMSYGRPVVGFRVGGIPEWLLDGEVGFLVESRDVDGLAARIEVLLHDRTLARRFGTRARALVAERFTIGRHVDGLLSVFDHAVRARRARERVAIG